MLNHEHHVEDREWRISAEGRSCRVHCCCGWVGGWRPARVRATLLFEDHVLDYVGPLAS